MTASKILQRVSLQSFSNEDKTLLLKELGYDSDGTYVLKDGKKHLDKYTEEPIMLTNMLILPGSTIILDNNPLSVSSYLEEFGYDL